MLKKVLVLLVVLGIAFGVMLLTTGDSRFEVSQTGTIDAQPEEVWSVLLDLETWPEWWPGVEVVTLTEPPVEGGSFELRLKGEREQGAVEITLLHEFRELIWMRKGLLGSRGETGFNLQRVASGTELTVTNTISGPQAFLARITGRDSFIKYQDLLLRNIALFLQKDSDQRPLGEKD